MRQGRRNDPDRLKQLGQAPAQGRAPTLPGMEIMDNSFREILSFQANGAKLGSSSGYFFTKDQHLKSMSLRRKKSSALLLPLYQSVSLPRTRKGSLPLKNILTSACTVVPLLFVAACNTTASVDPAATGSISQDGFGAGKAIQRGTASWYGPGFHGRRTASGERFNSLAMTAAHPTLPFGTKLRVVNESNGRSVVVRVNDRGPFAHRRIIDLAKGPAQALGLTSSGTAYVSLHKVE